MMTTSGYLDRSDSDDLPVQDDRYDFGGLNPGLASIRPSRVLRLVAHWRENVEVIGPYLEGAAFQQCSDDLIALLFDESDLRARKSNADDAHIGAVGE